MLVRATITSYTNHIHSRYNEGGFYYIREHKLLPIFAPGIMNCGSELVTRIACGIAKNAFFVKYILINDIYIQPKDDNLR